MNEYQKAALESAIYPSRGNNLVYPALKLAGEAGEVAEKVGKILRDKHGFASGGDKFEIAKELGDVLWYVAAMADEIGFELADIASMNLAKLASRKARGVLGGSGDNR